MSKTTDESDYSDCDSPNKSDDNYRERLKMPTIRGGLNGSISDILEASGYGTETDFKTDEDIKYVERFVCGVGWVGIYLGGTSVCRLDT